MICSIAQNHTYFFGMSAPEDNVQLVAPRDHKKRTSGAMSAIVVISSDSTAENIVATLKDDSSAADSISEPQDSIDVTILPEINGSNIVRRYFF